MVVVGSGGSSSSSGRTLIYTRICHRAVANTNSNTGRACSCRFDRHGADSYTIRVAYNA